ncbi:MAG TPA: AAA family ATPase, partial [Isosphaeraceae bacterium]|nr:AAA family ATPase [Isosphaeraceae bacterium]
QPLGITATFQAQIVRASEFDLALFIFWARLGTPLPGQMRRPDGTPYASGTEFEFEDALQAHEQTGRPDIVVYRKSAQALAALDDPEQVQKSLAQKQALDAFCARWLGAPDEPAIAAFHTFEKPDEFERRLETHLRKQIRERLARLGRHGATRAQWPQSKGSPYRGLAPYEREHAQVFYGREKAVNAIKAALQAQAKDGGAFVLIFGMSGCGKSSLARAGVLARLMSGGSTADVGLWRSCVLRPSDAASDLCLGLAEALFGETALPELSVGGYSAAALAAALREAPEHAVGVMSPALHRAAEVLSQTRGQSSVPQARLLLVIDQLEELFTVERFDAEQRARFVDALAALARSGRVWVLATMRSDFFGRCWELPSLDGLKKGHGQYDLLPPSFAEIGQMIRLPARDAGLRFEQDPTSKEWLDDVLHEAAARDPESLPLLAFVLDRLYADMTQDRVLTFASYRRLGGLEGALAQYAEEVFSQLNEAAQAALPSVLPALVTVSPGQTELAASVRVAADQLDAPAGRKALVDAMVNARLLVADRAEGGQPVIGLVHEALLRHWARLRNWIEADREFLRVRTRVADAAARWRQEGGAPDLLLPEGKPLFEARDLLAKRRGDLDGEVIEYIERSMQRRGRRRRNQRILLAGFFLTIAIFATVSFVEWQAALAQKKAADTQQRLAVQQKELALKALDSVTFDIPDELKNLPGSQKVLAQVLERNILLLDQVFALNLDPLSLRVKSVNLDRQGDAWLILGNISRARDAYEKSLAIRLGLDRRGRDGRTERDLFVSYQKVGDVRLQLNDLRGAREAFEKCLAAALALEKEKPTVQAKRDLSDTQAQADLAVASEKVGDVALLENDVRAARAAQEKSLAIRLELASHNPSRQAKRDLAISFHKVGDVQLQFDDLSAAREAYGKALDIRLELARDMQNAQAQRDLSLSYDATGTLDLRLNDLEGAREAYERSLAIRLELAKDKQNTQAQRDLSVSYDEVGRIRVRLNDLPGALEACEKSLAIRKELASDVNNAETKRDLSISYERLGRVHLLLNDLEAARDAFERSLAIRLELAKDTHNARSQRDVSIAFERLGDVRQKLGDLAGAHSAYQKSLAIRLELAKEKQNAEAQRDLYETYNSIGQVLLLSDDFRGACEALANALDVAREISRAGQNPNAQKALAQSYGDLAWAELFQRRFDEAIAAAREGLKADPTQTIVATNLAHGLLFTNQLE